MDITFTCPNCRQELEADATGAGSEIQCPECRFAITIPHPTPRNLKAMPGAAPTGAAPAKPAPAASEPEGEKKEHTISLPKPGAGAKVEISRPKLTLENAAKGADSKPRIRTFLHADFAAQGAGAFDKAVSEFLQNVGEAHIHAVLPVQQAHEHPVTKNVLIDFGVVVHYRG